MGLYNSEFISPQGCNFQAGGIAYDKKPWTYLTVDFIIKLLLVAGKNAILVVCDRLSKITNFVATTEETSAEGLARLFKDNM